MVIFPKRDDLRFLKFLDPRHGIARAALGDDQFVQLGVKRDIAAMRIGLALVLAIEHHLRQRDRKDGERRGQQVGRQPEREPGDTEQDHPDLHQWIGEQIRHDGRNRASDRIEAALSAVLGHNASTTTDGRSGCNAV